MLLEKRCMNCMTILDEDENTCPHCGSHIDDLENEPNYLPIGTEFSDRYVIGKVQNYSGATVCYIGYDKIENTIVYIHEFFPANIAQREEDGMISPLDDCKDSFDYNLLEFKQTTRTMARLRDLPIMVPTYDIFEENNTIYTVSEMIESTSLSDYLKQKGGTLSVDEAKKLFLPFLASLSSCHSAGLMHFGICPSNLLIGTDGKLKLVGFDVSSVRTMNTALKSQITDCYAAPEQYSFDGELSEATDVYGITAVLFRCLTGNPPPSGSHRNPRGEDLLLSSGIAKKLPSYICDILIHGLQPHTRKRIPSIEELHDSLSTGAIVSELSDETKVVGVAGALKNLDHNEKPKRNKNAMILTFSIIGFIALLTIIVIIIICTSDNKKPEKESSEPLSSTTITSTNTTSKAISQEESAKAPDLVNAMQNYYDLDSFQGTREFSSYQIELAGFQYSDEERGIIVAQEPKAGSPIKEGQTIRVYISAGKEQTTVPDVTGWKMEQAQLYLEALGFRVEVTDADDASMEYNAVVGTWPSAGNELDADHTITLRINKAEPTTAETEATQNSETEENSTDSVS